MKTSLLNNIEKWANRYVIKIKEIKQKTKFVVVSINNHSVTYYEIKALEKVIQYWFENAHWYSVDQKNDGLEIWIKI